MILNGYFILDALARARGNAPDCSFFAGIELDFIAISILRSSPYSGLDELVAESPVTTSPQRKIYSDHCSVWELRNLRHRIYREFYTLANCSASRGRGFAMDSTGFFPSAAATSSSLVRGSQLQGALATPRAGKGLQKQSSLGTGIP